MKLVCDKNLIAVLIDTNTMEQKVYFDGVIIGIYTKTYFDGVERVSLTSLLERDIEMIRRRIVSRETTEK